ncbi:MAG: 23S rRNA pseudouridine(1911/1915/1917) synthase RluD [Gammaproteobacteria bacterium]|nr:23S rRNA pseudouridine(1911/1915/1917) synthase RluD [Gammaproteobacteria bacterium]
MSDTRQLQIPLHLAGQRLDRALAQLVPEYSRNRLQQWIRDGQVLVDGERTTPRAPVVGGAQVQLRAVAQPLDSPVQAQPIPLDIRYRDAHLLVINKPPGLVVHPAAGNPDGTLQNALLYADPALATVPRAGIVHRLDKDTSGLLVVARTLQAHSSLVRQLAERTVRREYLALVGVEVIAGGRIEAAIGRHPVDRKRMAVNRAGKPAVTEYRVATRYRGFTLLRVHLHSGRTHQIRVHLQHLGMPLVGDRTYGGRARYPRGANAEVRAALDAFPRQALHAALLGLQHPASGDSLHWESDLPEDFEQLLSVLA